MQAAFQALTSLSAVFLGMDSWAVSALKKASGGDVAGALGSRGEGDEGERECGDRTDRVALDDEAANLAGLPEDRRTRHRMRSNGSYPRSQFWKHFMLFCNAIIKLAG